MITSRAYSRHIPLEDKAAYDERKHPRDESGRWTSGGAAPTRLDKVEDWKEVPLVGDATNLRHGTTKKDHVLYAVVPDYMLPDVLEHGLPYQDDDETTFGNPINGTDLNTYADAHHYAWEDRQTDGDWPALVAVNVPAGTHLYYHPAMPSTLIYHGAIPASALRKVEPDEAAKATVKNLSEVITGNRLEKRNPDEPLEVTDYYYSDWIQRNSIPSGDVPRDEQLELADYSDYGYRSMNTYLRRQAQLGPEAGGASDAIDQRVALLDALVARGKLKDATIVYRVMDGAPPFAEGTLFKDGGFVSTSLSNEILERTFGGDKREFTEIKMALPRGQTAFYVTPFIFGANQSERELLLPRGMTFKVKSITPVEQPGYFIPEGEYNKVPGTRVKYSVVLELVTDVKKSATEEETVDVSGGLSTEKYEWRLGDLIILGPISKHYPNLHDQKTHGHWTQTVINDFKFTKRASKLIPLIRKLGPKKLMDSLMGRIALDEPIYHKDPLVKMLPLLGVSLRRDEDNDYYLNDTQAVRQLVKVMDAYKEFVGGGDELSNYKTASNFAKLVQPWMDGKADKGLDIMWAATQAYLKGQAVVLHRGLGLPPKTIARLDAGEIQATDVDTVGHWTERFDTAKGFSRDSGDNPVVFIMKVPAKYILFHYKLWAGPYEHEREIVPLMSAHPRIRTTTKVTTDLSPWAAKQLKKKAEALKKKEAYEKKKAKAKEAAMKKYGKKFKNSYFEAHYYDPSGSFDDFDDYELDESEYVYRTVDLEFRKK